MRKSEENSSFTQRAIINMNIIYTNKDLIIIFTFSLNEYFYSFKVYDNPFI